MEIFGVDGRRVRCLDYRYTTGHGKNRQTHNYGVVIVRLDHPVIPLYIFVSKHLVSPEVEGWGDNVLDYHYSQHLSLSAPD